MAQTAPRIDAYVGVGSNLGNPSRQVEAALERIAGLPGTSIVARSSLYRSAPYGGVEQPDFINGAIRLETVQPPRTLLSLLQAIETAHGRERREQRWGPRVIDLDLLVYADLELIEPGLVLPHPGIAERNFVLLPLREIAPDLHIPGIGALSAIEINYDEPRIERIG